MHIPLRFIDCPLGDSITDGNPDGIAVRKGIALDPLTALLPFHGDACDIARKIIAPRFGLGAAKNILLELGCLSFSVESVSSGLDTVAQLEPDGMYFVWGIQLSSWICSLTSGMPQVRFPFSSKQALVWVCRMISSFLQTSSF